MNILITGATGFVGQHTTRELSSRGHHVFALVRQTSQIDFLRELGVTLVFGDLSQKTKLGLPRLDSVIHLAGLIKAKKTSEFYRVNVDGTRHLAENLQGQNLKSFVHVSSIAARGPNKSLTDFTSPGPTSHYGRSKLESENVVQNNLNPKITTIVRPPLIYGPEDHATLILFKLFEKRFFPLIGTGEQYFSFLFVKDLAKILADVAEHPLQTTISPEDGAQGHTWKDVVTIAQTIYQNKIWTPHLPLWTAKMMARAFDFFGKCFGFVSVFGKDKFEDAKQPFWTCSNEGLPEDQKPKTQLKDGFKLTKEWYETQGWI